MNCHSCKGCGCPSCLGTGSGNTQFLVRVWGNRNSIEGLTPKKVPDLPVTEQRKVQAFVRTHNSLMNTYDAKAGPESKERGFLIECPKGRLIPADEPRFQRVRFENGKVQIRVYYQHALEEPLVAVEGKYATALVGLNSDRLFMIELEPTKMGDAEQFHKDLMTAWYSVKNLRPWSQGSNLNHEYALSNKTELAEWFASL